MKLAHSVALKFDRRGVHAITGLIFCEGKARLHGCVVNKLEARHFEFAIVTLCAWAGGKTADKVKIRPGLLVPYEQSEKN